MLWNLQQGGWRMHLDAQIHRVCCQRCGKASRAPGVADRKSAGEITPPVSLHPLSFDEAMKALMGVEPQRVGLGNKQGKHKPKSKGNKSHSN